MFHLKKKKKNPVKTLIQVHELGTVHVAAGKFLEKWNNVSPVFIFDVFSLCFIPQPLTLLICPFFHASQASGTLAVSGVKEQQEL